MIVHISLEGKVKVPFITFLRVYSRVLKSLLPAIIFFLLNPAILPSIHPNLNLDFIIEINVYKGNLLAVKAALMFNVLDFTINDHDLIL